MRRFANTWHAVDSAYAGTMPLNRSRKARAALRRKRRMDRVEHDLNEEQWTALKAAWGGCAYCGAINKPLQRDCVLALSRGGRYTLENIAPACGSCNASKCNDEVTGWLRRKRLDERAFLLRHLEINAMLALQFLAANQKTLLGVGEVHGTG
jgi:5-methylcytosine-specific restriction endonuclease McrA